MKNEAIWFWLFLFGVSCAGQTQGCGCTRRESCDECVGRCQGDFAVSVDACKAAYCQAVCNTPQ
jgi:hypothetical protein